MERERIDFDLVNDYREKYVVFLDLLGFRELVKKIGQDVHKRERAESRAFFSRPGRGVRDLRTRKGDPTPTAPIPPPAG